MKKDTYTRGIYAEKFAHVFLLCKGYKILKKRFKTKVGEIDILAARGGTLVAIEVKFRKKAEELPFTMRLHQRKRIRRTLEWAHQYYPHYMHLRCDTLLISLTKWPIHRENEF